MSDDTEIEIENCEEVMANLMMIHHNQLSGYRLSVVPNNPLQIKFVMTAPPGPPRD